MKWALFSSPNLYGAIDEREQYRLELIIATARGFLAAIAMLLWGKPDHRPFSPEGLFFMRFAALLGQSPSAGKHGGRGGASYTASPQ